MNLIGWAVVPDWVILGVILLWLLYKYMTRYKDHWRQQGIPYEELSLLRPFIKAFKPLHLQDQERCERYGKLFGIFEGGRPVLMVADAELVKRAFLTDFSALPQRRRFFFHDEFLDSMLGFVDPSRWKRLRTACSPAFSAAKLRHAYAAMQSCAKVARDNLIKVAESVGETDVKHFFGNYTIDVIARFLFGTAVDSYNDETHEFVQAGRDVLGGDITLRKFLFTYFPFVLDALKISGVETNGLHRLKDLAYGIVRQRRKNGVRREDFLQMMMDVQDGTLSTATEKAETSEEVSQVENDVKADQTAKGITEDEALAQCVIFLFAGLDTTSMQLAFAAYLLAINPEAQEKLKAEIDQCFEKHGSDPPMDVVNKLQYLDGVVSESARVHPVAARIERTASKDYTLGDTGVVVPKGCVISVPVYAIHRDPENYPDPEKFDPTRFIGDNASSVKPLTYLPFGAGPLNCIGSRVALQAMKLCLLHILREVEFVRTPNTKVPVEFCNGSILSVTAKDITIAVRKRTV